MASRVPVALRQEHLPEVDLLRTVALLGVGVIHAGAWVTPADAPPGQSAMSLVSELARFSVPAFVFASGLVLFHAYGSRPISPGAFLRRRWSRVMLPWACCVPLFLAKDALGGDPAPRPGAVGAWLAFGPGHLYFLLLIAQLYLVFLVLPRDTRGLRWATAGLVAFQLGLMAWRSHGPLLGGSLAWPAVYLSHEEAPFWAGTFALGCLTAAEWPLLTRLSSLWPLALIASMAAAGLLLAESSILPVGSWRQGNAAYLWPARLPQTIAWCLALLWLGRRFYVRLGPAWALARVLSAHSLGIYLLHPIFLDLLGPHTAGWPAAIRVPALIACSFGCAYGAVRLLALSRPTAAAVGEQRAWRGSEDRLRWQPR